MFISYLYWPTAKRQSRDFPSGPVVRSLPANAGDMGSILSLGGSRLLRGNEVPVTTTEIRALKPLLYNKRSHCNEKSTYHN